MIYLTSLLFPLLIKSPESLIINVSSNLHTKGGIVWRLNPEGKYKFKNFLMEDLEEKDYNKMHVYETFKLGQVYF